MSIFSLLKEFESKYYYIKNGITKNSFVKPEVLNEEYVFANKYLKLKISSLLFKKGKEKLEKEYYSIDSSDCVVGIVVKDEQILLVSQYRFTINDFNTEFIAGMIDEEDTPEQAIKKELKEEAGIITDNVKFLGKLNPLIGQHSNYIHVFYVDSFEQNKNQLEKYEEFTGLNCFWMPIKKFKEMIRNNEIQDGITLMCWALFQSK
jgi:ADP-ribose pyrophosphatase